MSDSGSMKRKRRESRRRSWPEAIAAAPILGIGAAPDFWPTEAEWQEWRRLKEQDARIKARVMEHLYPQKSRTEILKDEIREKLKAFER